MNKLYKMAFLPHPPFSPGVSSLLEWGTSRDTKVFKDVKTADVAVE
ncbi:MAG TPA: hypothetical protein VHB48_20490 [Chitinophagaceae bacterium]|nr:hypothetical protein [Chitinophagaceae bacterium]